MTSDAVTKANVEQVAFVSRPTIGDYMWNAIAITRSSMVSTAIGTFATTSGLLATVLTGDISSVVVLLAGLSFLTGVFVVPFVWWPIHQRRDLVLAPVDVVADKSGVSFTTATSTGRHDWSVFRRVRETSGAFIFDTGTNVAILVAKRDVSERDVAGLRSLLVATGTMRPPTTGVDRLRPLLGVAVGIGATAFIVIGAILLGPGR